MSEVIPATGIPLPSGSLEVPVRRDINEWYRDRDSENPENVSQIQVSLYVHALQIFQDMDYKDERSYFRIAAIHGWPEVPWNDIGTGFFCAHNTPTFPTWHRPYLALYEQRIYECMLEFINTKVDEARKPAWTAAAQQWRLPYWDYATEAVIADIAANERIEVLAGTGSNGKTVTVYNPNYSYRIATKKPLGDPSMGDYAVAPGTVFGETEGTSRHVNRNTDRNGWIKGKSNSSQVTSALGEGIDGEGSIKNAVYRLLSSRYFGSWRTFSSTKLYNRNQRPNDFLSIEQIHNYIHSMTGGGGHMNYPQISAFDPIFWNHHCFVDRLTAIWQSIPENADKWFDRPLPAGGRPPAGQDPATFQADPPVTAPLQPFRDQDGKDWTSENVRDWRQFGYDYSDLSYSQFEGIGAGGETNEESLASKINRLYGADRDDMLNLPQSGLVPGESDEIPDVLKNDYIINVIYDRYGLEHGAPYSIIFSLGTEPIGTIYNFSFKYSSSTAARPGSECQNCKKQDEDNVLSCGQVALTITLRNKLRSGDLANYDEPTVEAYLKANLTVRIVDPDGGEIQRATLEPALKIAIFAGKADHDSNSDVLSTYKDHTVLYYVDPAELKDGNHPQDYQEVFGTDDDA